jgi:hypothetical protein
LLCPPTFVVVMLTAMDALTPFWSSTVMVVFPAAIGVTVKLTPSGDETVAIVVSADCAVKVPAYPDSLAANDCVPDRLRNVNAVGITTTDGAGVGVGIAVGVGVGVGASVGDAVGVGVGIGAGVDDGARVCKASASG